MAWATKHTERAGQLRPYCMILGRWETGLVDRYFPLYFVGQTTLNLTQKALEGTLGPIF